MRFYNTKTGKRYESPPLLIVGDVSASVRTITAYGFFAAMIHVDDGAAIPSNRQFIVAENVPPGWTGETITADKFAATMDERIVKPGEKKTATLASTMTATQRSSMTRSTIAVMPCCGGNKDVTE